MASATLVDYHGRLPRVDMGLACVIREHLNPPAPEDPGAGFDLQPGVCTSGARHGEKRHVQAGT